MPKKKNPWEKISQPPPKYQVGDIVYTYLTYEGRFVNVPAIKLPRRAFIQLSKGIVVGFKIGKSNYSGTLEWLPLYIVKTLEIYFDAVKILEVGKECNVNRWWVEQGDDAYIKVFKKLPRRKEFVFR